MIMEYAEGGELFNYIIEKGNLSEDESRNIFQQIIDAIYYLHQMGVCHRDLKPENILFDSKDRKKIKIIDFGLSNLYITENISHNDRLSLSTQKELLETPCGSPGYAPPEMILGCKYDGIMTDIWSCGIILYAMLCGCLPFDDFSEDKLYSKIIRGRYDYPPMIEISDEAKNFINSILVVNPKERANIEEIRNNKWFLKNYKPIMGLYISICEIPISDLIVKEMEKRDYEKKKIVKYIKNNNHNSLTTLYYLLVKQKLKEGIETESDMISNIFQQFIKIQNKKNQKKNVKPINLKMLILKSEKKLEKSKENKDIKERKYLDNYENKEKGTSYRENRSKKIINENKDIENKDNHNKNLYKNKDKTISKEKNQNTNNIHIKNIKNIFYMNINNLKTNILIKTNDSDNNRIKLYKKMADISKNRKDILNSNSKNKKNKKLNTININKMKEGQFRSYMNLQNNKNNGINPRTKRLKKEKINLMKNNRTMLGDSNQINKDFNLTLNFNENKNNSIITDKNYIKKGIFLSKNIYKINFLNRYKFLMKNKIKCKKKKNIGEIRLIKLCSNKIKGNEIIGHKHNNSRKKLNKENNLTNKINNLKIESIPKIALLLNDFKTSRIVKNRYTISSVSNSRSKSKSKDSSSNSKSNSITDRVKKERFFVFKTSRNNDSRSKSGNKNTKNIYTNLTLEKLSNINRIKQNKNSIGKEKKNYIKSINLINNRIHFRCSTTSKSKKKVLPKPKNNANTNSYYYKLQNFKTSIQYKKLKNKIKHNNYMNIIINNKDNNSVQMLNKNIKDNIRTNENISNIYEEKNNKSLNLTISVNPNKNKEGFKLNKKSKNKDESFNQSNIIQKIRIRKDNIRDYKVINNYKKQKINLQNINLNNINKSKLNFHSINTNYYKFKENIKYSTINNA